MFGGRSIFGALRPLARALAGCAALWLLAGPLPAATKEQLAKGEAALEAKNFNWALEVFGEILKGDPTCVAAYVGRGRAHRGRRENELAIADYTEALKRNPKSTDALWYRAHAYRAVDDYAKAAPDIDALIEIEPDSRLNFRVRARNRKDLKDFAGAMADVTKALDFNKDLNASLELRADIFAAAGAYTEAIRDYTTLISADGKKFSLLLDRARLYDEIGSYAEAVADFENALKLTSESASLFNSYAWMLAVCPDPKFQNGPKAVELAKKACELTQWQAGGLVDTLAAAYARAGDFEEAVRWQKKAVELMKDRPNIQEIRDRVTLFEQKKAFVEEPSEKAKIAWSLLRTDCFETVWATVNENYYDTTFGGVDWAALREKYRLRLWSAPDKQSLGRLLQEMLNELKRTHFAIVPREMSVLAPEERGRIGRSGALTSVIENEITVVRVAPGSPAETAGVKVGDIVRRVEKHKVSDVLAAMDENVGTPQRRLLYLRSFVNWWLSAPVGRKVSLELEGADGKTREVSFATVAHEGLWSEASGSTPSEPLEVAVEKSGQGVVYLRFNAFALPTMNEFKRVVRSLQPGQSLLIDLRGNGGGLTLMAAGIAGRLIEKECSLGTMTRRYSKEDFPAYPQKGAFAGPVAVLVDSGSASTSEILAAGLQETGRARIFGETTAGAALPSFFRKLPTGDLLQYAIADIKTPKGTLIEGNGVQPDETVALRRADCLAGRDTVREAAESWLAGQGGGEKPAEGGK